ncbi:Protein FRG1 [Oopsacas minuta]|uniref:Protein FRG1 n=1 Tax=Oopsacas minuta TaxID=111878 RepID=A0AAV7KGI0_9METZ|nr:Protein FRG1 [Oopsacas minuta]
MDAVKIVGGPLRLKGTKSSLSKQRKKRIYKENGEEVPSVCLEGGVGRWIPITNLEDVVGPVAFRTYTGGFMVANEEGTFWTTPEGKEEPGNLEQFSLVIVSENKVTIRSPFNRYLGIDASGKVTGRSEAAGMREQFESVFEDGKVALLASNQRFLSFSANNDAVASTGQLTAVSEKAKLREMFILLCGRRATKKVGEWESELIQYDVDQIEKSYVRQYQSFQGGKVKMHSSEVKKLCRAQRDGQLHTMMLDRRSKMKSDKFCK